MLAEQRHDRSALRWIRGELDQTLREARAALEDFVDGQQARLIPCVDALHHVQGALGMTQVYGGAMLADEMEQLALAMSQSQVKDRNAAAEALMLGMVNDPEESWWVVLSAMDVLGSAKAELIVPHVDRLVHWLKHDDWWLRNATLTALTPVVADERSYKKVLPAIGELVRTNQRSALTKGLLPGIRAKIKEAGAAVRSLETMGARLNRHAPRNL